MASSSSSCGLMATTSRPGPVRPTSGSSAGSSQVIAKGATFATWSPDGSSLYYFTKAGATTRARWRFEEGHLDTGDVVRDRFIGKGDAYLYGYFGTSTRPCPKSLPSD